MASEPITLLFPTLVAAETALLDLGIARWLPHVNSDPTVYILAKYRGSIFEVDSGYSVIISGPVSESLRESLAPYMAPELDPETESPKS